MSKLSIIMPFLNEIEELKHSLPALYPLLNNGHELILVDGGSRDGGSVFARKWATRVVMSGPGRALQMNAGAELANHEILVFLHADTQLPLEADKCILRALEGSAQWGFFSVKMINPSWRYRILSKLMNLRSRLTHIATGDQTLFMYRSSFEKVGAYDRIALMEDIVISAKLKHLTEPAIIENPVLTSARRWEKHGFFLTILKMWFLRAAFALGMSPATLARLYDK
jgi:rSAM/selenodomain-associated transferase 2